MCGTDFQFLPFNENVLSAKEKEKKFFQGYASLKKNQQERRDFDSPFKANSLLAQVKWLLVFFCKVNETVEVLGPL